MIYRIVPDRHLGYRVQIRSMGMWWTAAWTYMYGDIDPRSFPTKEEARAWIDTAIKERTERKAWLAQEPEIYP